MVVKFLKLLQARRQMNNTLAVLFISDNEVSRFLSGALEAVQNTMSVNTQFWLYDLVVY